MSVVSTPTSVCSLSECDKEQKYQFNKCSENVNLQLRQPKVLNTPEIKGVFDLIRVHGRRVLQTRNELTPMPK